MLANRPGLTPWWDHGHSAPEHYAHKRHIHTDVVFAGRAKRAGQAIMASGSMTARMPVWREQARRGAMRGGAMLGALVMIVAVALIALALVSYEPTDASINTAAGGPTRNWAGVPGAWAADLILSVAGPAMALFLPYMLVVGMRIGRGAAAGRWRRSLLLIALGVVFAATALGLAGAGRSVDLPGGWGGALGWLGARGAEAAIGAVTPPAWLDLGRIAAMMLTGSIGLGLWILGLGLGEGERRAIGALFRGRPRADEDDYDDDYIDEVETDFEDDLDDRPVAEPKPPRERRPKLALVDEPEPEPSRPVIADRQVAMAPPARRERQASLDLRDKYTLPGVDLLKPPPPSNGQAVDKAGLERNARLLENVLEDFHVKGRITEVRPGPVVTMYELEPASGIKASRVIQLADDIARNMSALSARVATIPGRTVIGIELPNVRREMVSLSEMVGSSAFEDQAGQLPIILGKNIAGDPVVADLAPMPHLLVAGTTGSGKSVGLNCMILSLLYRLTPDQCRMIMIDPKMLELSIYDDIPHLLAPVVTDPPKAIRALKWAVEQMEERYRMMASLSVRGLASYNEKVRAAKGKGQALSRKVQIGYDPETGQPLYEQENLDYDVLPQIVVIVDELADLMMTAGKEVEFLIQRLAQKARAAGIHLIMATQRPSVDVITGVIKANLPTRISFAVTSKIDSRTILGEQGAEQLLGKGDMLYMPGGKQTARVHGPFVSDEEVRAVADFWKAQGAPDYIQAVTEEPEDGGFALDGAPEGDDSPEDQLYRRAVQTVADSQKASTSYIQRQLRIGYNSAARLIERMEKEGVVSRPDHVGRREVLVDGEGRPL